MLSGQARAQSVGQILELDAAPVARTSAGPENGLIQVVDGVLLRDGSFVAADMNERRLHRFDTRGKLVSSFVRTGKGPGEIETVTRLLRCGDSLAVLDGPNQKISVFNHAGAYGRSMQLISHPSGNPPQRLACNSRMQFLQAGWSLPRDARPGRYRGMVPVWLGDRTLAVGKSLALRRGTESVMLMRGGKPIGVRPQPLGYVQLIALGSTNGWLLDTQESHIVVLNVNGDSVGAIDLGVRPSAPSKADIAEMMEQESAVQNKAAVRASYADLDFSRPLPIATGMFVGRKQRLWVGMTHHADSDEQEWRVYATGARSYSLLRLPATWRLLDADENMVLVVVTNASDGMEEMRVYRTKGKQ